MAFVAKHSAEWNRMRVSMIGAGSLAQAMGKVPNDPRQRLIEFKARQKPISREGYVQKHPGVRWGVMFEPMASRCFGELYGGGVPVREVGLTRHPTLACFGAEADGMTDNGHVVEIKCPWKRAVGGDIPVRYLYQMLGEMAVYETDTCDFVECNFAAIADIDEYFRNTNGNKHGVVLEFGADTFVPRYEYSPPSLTPSQVMEWTVAHPSYASSKPHLWKLENMVVRERRYDGCLWAKTAPLIRRFWDEVLALRVRIELEHGAADDVRLLGESVS